MSDADVAGRAKTCFVAMPITTPEAYADELGDKEHFAHVLAHLFKPALEAAGLTAIAPLSHQVYSGMTSRIRVRSRLNAWRVRAIAVIPAMRSRLMAVLRRVAMTWGSLPA